MSRIVLTTIGTLGDLHPKIAIALELQKRGHQYSASRVAKELRELLENPIYAVKATQIGGIIQAENGVNVACDAIEKMLQAI